MMTMINLKQMIEPYSNNSSPLLHQEVRSVMNLKQLQSLLSKNGMSLENANGPVVNTALILYHARLSTKATSGQSQRHMFPA